MTQVKIGDAPADRVVSFEVSVGAMSMTPSSGSAMTVLPGTSDLEMTHLSDTSEPLSLLNVPQGGYTSLAMTVSKLLGRGMGVRIDGSERECAPAV